MTQITNLASFACFSWFYSEDFRLAADNVRCFAFLSVRRSLNVNSPESAIAAYGAKSETIQTAIRALKGNFTQDAVEAEIRRINPSMEINRNRIRSALWILCSKY